MDATLVVSVVKHHVRKPGATSEGGRCTTETRRGLHRQSLEHAGVQRLEDTRKVCAHVSERTDRCGQSCESMRTAPGTIVSLPFNLLMARHCCWCSAATCNSASASQSQCKREQYAAAYAEAHCRSSSPWFTWLSRNNALVHRKWNHRMRDGFISLQHS